TGTAPQSPCITDASVQVSANPPVVTLGGATWIQWSIITPGGCDSVTARFDGQTVDRAGSRQVKPGRTKRFTVVEYLGTTQGTSGFADVQVDYPPRVVIDPRTPEPERALVGALLDSTNPEQVVELCNVDLNLTGYTSIGIGDNRSLIASPACA